jgi:hypothetical protein
MSAIPNFDKATQLAFHIPLLSKVIAELDAANCLLCSGGKAYLPDNEQGTPPQVGWTAQILEEDTHTGVVLSISPLDGSRWGVSVKASACGLNGGVGYWRSTAEPPTGVEEHWPGLATAIAKAKLLAAARHDAAAAVTPTELN